jgi:outer membrane beta-barrel protein
MRIIAQLTLGFLALSTGWISTADAGREPAQKALTELNNPPVQDVVQNRFFLKDGRFELAGVGGYVPNNPMVQRVSGGFFGAYHISEKFAAEGAVMYFPDLSSNDLKGLTKKLVEIASDRSGQSNFEQPLEKMMLGATFVGRWSPIYGKINLIGESVLNFDLYFVGGLGMLSSKKYYAYSADDAIQLRFEGNTVHVPANLGMGINFFVNQSLAVKLDARSFIYRAPAPIYDPNDQDQLNQYRIYNDIVTSVGVSYFIPKMKPRLMDF